MSGTAPSAGPKFVKSGTAWRVIAPEVVLRNTVTDADGDTANLTFQVYTANADGTPKAQVDLDGSGQYGVLVSPYVASGGRAQVKVPYGILKPGVLYKFRTSAFDGSLYETTWSPWADFRIEPYVKYPAPQTSSTIDTTAQEIDEFTRTDPGPALPTFTASGAVKREATQERTCGKRDAEGRKICIKLSPPTAESKARAKKRAEALRKAEEAKARKAGKSPAEAAAVAADAPLADLVDWCSDEPVGKDYMNRTDACVKSIGSGTLVFIDTNDATIGTATFDFEQRIKTYPNKGTSGSNFAEFDQQIRIMPVAIDPTLEGVTLKWNTQSTCAACVTSVIRWADDFNNFAGDNAYWDADNWNAYTDGRWGTRATQWNGTGKERIDLSWSVTATVDASDTAFATADFGTSGIAQVQELAPRCDDYVAGSYPGCVLPFFSPTWTVDTNKYPAAGAYYWYMQQVMPDHAGSKRWDSLLHYLGPDTLVKNSSGATWTSDDSRKVICGTSSSWSVHPSDASVGSVDCDEYAMASTHESGGYPQSVNLVTSGTKCAQLFTDKMGDGSANFGILADTRTVTNGPSGTERCGRAAIPSTQNQQAFSGFPAPAWRMLDGDGFFVTLPGFEHCTSTATTCTWSKVG
ncbi:cell envelope integrity protein TolA [Streptomyces sp. NPDC001761]